MTNKFYITTPIYYVNASPHIGHLYTTLAADILTRAHKQWGENVFFLTGTDEHGAKIAQAAGDFGEIKGFTDKVSEEFKDAWKLFDINYDYFIRTTNPQHEKFVQEFLTKLYKKGDIYLGKYRGLYCTGCEEYKKESDLENGLCPLHKKKPEKIQEEVYFFKLSKYKEKILASVGTDKFQILPQERKNEVLSFLKQELEDTAVSRTKVSWGISVPWDKKHIIYVWFDALLNYLSALEINKSPNIWPPDVQLIAKDILRFHAIIWPAILLAAGLELPKILFVHGFFTVNKQKVSKSLGNVITPQELIDRYGVDAARFLLISAFPFGSDGDFSFDDLDKRYNAILANDLGNLVQRAVVLAQKNNIKFIPKNPQYSEKIKAQLEKIDFYSACEQIKKAIVEANVFVNETKPWETKDKKTIAELLNKIEKISVDLKPFMPTVGEKILTQLKTLQPEILFPKK